MDVVCCLIKDCSYCRDKSERESECVRKKGKELEREKESECVREKEFLN